MNLRFPELGGGPVQGLNDAGVENFQGAIDVYLSRECGQNTGDAPRVSGQTVRLEFERQLIDATAIPAFSELRLTLNACLERWQEKEKEKEFFDQAVDLASADKITVLRISDYGTTGLTGDDADERGRWFALVKSQGVSNKENTAGGSFGIGKSSPFAASRFRTVFYGTKTETGAVALQGVSRLVTHKNEKGKLTQGTGFIGEFDPAGEDKEPVFRAIRNEDKIPIQFRRAEPGTDIWIIGYKSGDQWEADLTRSILANFWPAIQLNRIEFKVGSRVISKSNLATLIQEYVGQEDFEAHHFYQAISNSPIKKTLKYTGICELYLSAAGPELPRKICMVRNSGMKIFDYQPRACRVPFSGLFICLDQEGNKLLRKLEPPKHDIWDPKRIEDQSGKKALEEIKLWIRGEVQQLNPLFAGSSFNENELAKYVPDLTPDDPSDIPADASGTAEEEQLEPKPTGSPTEVAPTKAKPISERPSPGAGGGHTGNGDGGGRGGKKNPKSGEGTNGGQSDDSDLPTIHVRSFNSINDENYNLVLRSDIDFSGGISIRAVGEDGQQERVLLTAAWIHSSPSEKLPIHEDTIENVTLAAGVPLRVSVALADADRRALTIVPKK